MKKFLVLIFVSISGLRCWAADGPPAPVSPTPVSLTLQEARQLALKQNPKVSVANLIALATRQVTKEVRSIMLPQIFANSTAVGTGDPNNTRIAAGGLNNPLIYDREAEGVTVSQLITDFGRSSDLVKSAKSRERSEQMNLVATRAQLLLAVSSAYFSTLESQSVLKVAEETLNERKLVLEQTQTLAANQMKSQLDVSFASVDYYQAGILAVKARNDLKASFAVLSNVLGEPEPKRFKLADEPMSPYHATEYSALLSEAFQHRPDLERLRLQSKAAKEFAEAEHKLGLPVVSAVGTAGVVPTGAPQLPSDYTAGMINIEIPIFTGGLYSARRSEATLRATAAEDALRDEENTIAQDVEVTNLSLESVYERLGLTEKVLQNAAEALELAQARFQIGSSSIIELSQAELNKTSAQISETEARYDYQTQRSALDFQLGRLR